MRKIRLGIMGFGETGRHLYRACLEDNLIEVVAISDIGKPDILHYLLKSHSPKGMDVRLEGNHLVSANGRARMVRGISPEHVPWDAFDIDVVVDATGKYQSRHDMEQHLRSGAKRVILSSLPSGTIDRIAIIGVNEDQIDVNDKLISPGSATTIATGILLKLLKESIGVDYTMISTVHSYTADQPLRNVAGTDFRRSRSAAENIIPNTSPSPAGLEVVFPDMKGRIEGGALNVPVPAGSLLDLTTVMSTPDFSLDQVHQIMRDAAARNPHLIEIADDPIVSKDVLGNRHSVVYDVQATMKAGKRMLKTITWFHGYLSLAHRIKELILLYGELDKKGGLK